MRVKPVSRSEEQADDVDVDFCTVSLVEAQSFNGQRHRYYVTDHHSSFQSKLGGWSQISAHFVNILNCPYVLGEEKQQLPVHYNQPLFQQYPNDSQHRAVGNYMFYSYVMYNSQSVVLCMVNCKQFGNFVLMHLFIIYIYINKTADDPLHHSKGSVVVLSYTEKRSPSSVICSV